MTLIQAILIALGHLVGLVFIIWGIMGKIYERQIETLQEQVKKVNFIERYLSLKYEDRLKKQEEQLLKQKDIAIQEKDEEKRQAIEKLMEENKKIREEIKVVQKTAIEYERALKTAKKQSYNSGSIKIQQDDTEYYDCPHCGISCKESDLILFNCCPMCEEQLQL